MCYSCCWRIGGACGVSSYGWKKVCAGKLCVFSESSAWVPLVGLSGTVLLSLSELLDW